MGDLPAILIVRDDAAVRGLAFPLGHPVRGRAYVAHPMWARRYVPVDEASELLAREKVQVFQQVAAALGARRIELVRVVEREASGKGAVKLPLLKALLGIGGGKKVATSEATQDVVEFAAPPMVPFDAARWGEWVVADADLRALVELHRTTRVSSHEHEIETRDLQGVEASVAVQVASLGVERTKSERVKWRFRIDYFGDVRVAPVARAGWSLAAGAWLDRVAADRVPGRGGSGVVVAELAAETTAVLVDRAGVTATYSGPNQIDARELAGQRFEDVVLLDARPVLVRTSVDLRAPVAGCTAVVAEASAVVSDVEAVMRDARGSAEVASHSIARQVERAVRDALGLQAARSLDELRDLARAALDVALPAFDVQLRVSARRHLRSIDVAIGGAIDREGRQVVGTAVVTFESDADVIDVGALARQVGELVRTAVRARSFDDFERGREGLEEALRGTVAAALQRVGGVLREVGVVSLGDRLGDARDEMLAAREWMELDYERDELEALAREQMLSRRRRDAAHELAAAAVDAEVAIGKVQIDAQVRVARARAEAEVDAVEAHGGARVIEALAGTRPVATAVAGDDDGCPVRLELDRTALDSVRAGERFLLNFRAIARSAEGVSASIHVGSTPAAIDVRLSVRAGRVGRPSKPVAADTVLDRAGSYRLDGHVSVGEHRWWFSETLRVYAKDAGPGAVIQQAKFIANLDEAGGSSWRAVELHLDDEPAAPVPAAPKVAPYRFAPAFTARLRARMVPDRVMIAGTQVGGLDVARLLERGAIMGFQREGGAVIAFTMPELLVLCGEPPGVQLKPPPDGIGPRPMDAMIAFHRDGDRALVRRIIDTPDSETDWRDYIEETVVVRSCLGDDAARAFLSGRSPSAMCFTPACPAAWIIAFDDQTRAYQAHQASPRLFAGEGVNEMMHRLYWAEVLRETLLDDEARAVVAGVEREVNDGWMLVQVAQAWHELGDVARTRRVLEAAERAPRLGAVDVVTLARAWKERLGDPVRARRIVDAWLPRAENAFDHVTLAVGYQEHFGDSATMRRLIDRAADLACASDTAIRFELSWVVHCITQQLGAADATRLLDRAERAARTREARDAVAKLRARG